MPRQPRINRYFNANKWHLKNKYNLFRRIFFGFAIFMLSACQQPSEFHLLTGQKRSLKDYSGRWVLINFWAEWCRPCIEEVPELNQIHEKKDDLGVELIAFSFDPVSNEELVAAQQRFGMRYPMAATDPIPLVPFERPAKLPAMVIIGPDGAIHGPLYGKQDLASMAKILDQLSDVSD